MGQDLEPLVQRFLDGELTRAERQTLLRLLGSRPELRQRLIEDDMMLDDVAALPRAVVAPDFVARTMASLPARQDDAAATTVQRSRPPASRLSWAAAAILVLAAGFWAGRVSDPRSEPAPAATDAAPAESTVLVRLVLVDPGAQSVSVAGDFNDWDPARAPLDRTRDGVWSVMLPLNEGRYQYMFLVDGQRWMADPLAAETSDDGFGGENSVLDVEL